MSKIFIYSGTHSPTQSDLWQRVSVLAGAYLDRKSIDVKVLSKVDRRLFLDPVLLSIFGQIPCEHELEEHIDCGTCCVHVGHGTKEGFGTSGGEPVLSSWLSPKCPYFFMISCYVLAHGAHPFNNPAWAELNNPAHANVFDRWGSRLNERIRMVGGGCNSIWVNPETLANAFKATTDQGFPIADAFILAASTEGRISSCLARGNEEPVDTPLCTDRDFITKPNPVGGGRFFHLQYPQWSDQVTSADFWQFYKSYVGADAQLLTKETPASAVEEASPPPIIRLQRLRETNSSSVAEVLAEHVTRLPFGAKVAEREIAGSGLMGARIEPEGFTDDKLDSAEMWRDWVVEAITVLGDEFMHLSSEVNGLERGLPYTEYIYMMIDRVKAEGAEDGDVVRYSKCELSYLQPRLVFTNSLGDKALLPILDFDCFWWVRLSPVQIGSRHPIPLWEADITVGGFNIVAIEPSFRDRVAEAKVIPFELADGGVRSLLSEEDPLVNEYEWSAPLVRPGYRLVIWSDREWLLLVYRISVPPRVEAEVAGLQLDIPAFKVTEALRPLVAALYGGTESA